MWHCRSRASCCRTWSPFLGIRGAGAVGREADQGEGEDRSEARALDAVHCDAGRADQEIERSVIIGIARGRDRRSEVIPNIGAARLEHRRSVASVVDAHEAAARDERGIGVRSGGELTEPIIVDVAEAGDRDAEVLVRHISADDFDGVPRGPGEHDDRAAIDELEARPLVQRAGDDVGHAVAVDVARRCHRKAEPRSKVPVEGEEDRAGLPREDADESQRSAEAAEDVIGGSHGDLVGAVAVDVGDPRHRRAEVIARRISIPSMEEAPGLPGEDADAPGVGAVGVRIGHADGVVAVAVAVEIARAADRGAELKVGIASEVRSDESARLAGIHINGPRVEVRAVRDGGERPRSHRGARRCRCPHFRPPRSRIPSPSRLPECTQRPAVGRRIDVDAPRGFRRAVGVRRPDDHIGIPIIVDIAAARDGASEGVAREVPREEVARRIGIPSRAGAARSLPARRRR